MKNEASVAQKCEFIDFSKHLNWNVNEETCLCNRGKKGKEKQAAANAKRRAYYYKTEAAGLETKKKYREKAEVKRKILNQLAMLNVSKKVELCHEKIEQLVKML